MLKAKIKFYTLFIFNIIFVFYISCGDFEVSLIMVDIHYLKKSNSEETKPTAFLGNPFQLKVIVSGSQSTNNNPEKPDGIENFYENGI